MNSCGLLISRSNLYLKQPLSFWGWTKHIFTCIWILGRLNPARIKQKDILQKSKQIKLLLSLPCQRLECGFHLTDKNADALFPLKSFVRLESHKAMFTRQVMHLEWGNRDAARQMLQVPSHMWSLIWNIGCVLLNWNAHINWEIRKGGFREKEDGTQMIWRDKAKQWGRNGRIG